jgi:fibro-slime domain-containing protein
MRSLVNTELRSSLLIFLVSSAVFAGCSASGEPPGGAATGATGSGATGPILTGGSGGSGNGAGTGTVIDPSMTGGSTGEQLDCDSVLEVTYRDFSEAHPDFEMDFRGDVVRRGLIDPVLGVGKKPVFKNSIGCPALMTSPVECDTTWSVSVPVITSADSFANWYQTADGVNYEIAGQLTLTETFAGSAEYVYETAQFFPLAATDGFGLTPAGHHMQKNFLFTTEIHVNFEYRVGQRFSFRGDDDLWIFVNNKLAMDLGSMHGPAEGTIDFDAQAATLQIAPGNVYSMDIFHAERHTDGSNFKFTTNIACFTPVIVR